MGGGASNFLKISKFLLFIKSSFDVMLSLIKCLLFIFGQFEISFRLRQLRSELPKDQRRRNGGGKNDDLKGVGREGRTRVRQVGHA